MQTVWTKDYNEYNLPKVKEDTKTPILIIGGGIAGLMCAYNLMREKKEFILVEGEKLARGVSAYTTAQVSVAHGKLYEEIKKKHSHRLALEYYESQLEGLSIIRNIIKSEKINCDYKEESTIIHADKDKNLLSIIKQYELLKNYENINLLKSNKKPMKYRLGIEFSNQFIFNPIKYMNGIIDLLIKNKEKIYENSRVIKIKKRENLYEVLINNDYYIYAEKIIMACQYPIKNPDNLYFTKIYKSKSYAVSFKSKLKLSANYVSLDAPYIYIRSYDKDTLIIGGYDHFTGVNTKNQNYYNQLTQKIFELDKNAIIGYKWFAEDCIPIDSMPYVGVYSRMNPNIILVTGFQKWGFTNSHIAAKNVINILNNVHHNDLYKTHRWALFRDLKSTIRMMNHSLNGLIFSKIFIKSDNIKKININSGKAMKYKNKNILVYRESKNKYIFLKNKCTHMGCSLIWNDIDKVWESKCHGSIFDKYGKVIYGPATKDLETLYI
ncbi:MAG: FAD-dependent oxidoreductase [Bacilli bacterium]|nr:FAD-dependent oxidoreductase [Bacilli bacterium]